VSWDAVTGASSYQVYRDTSSGGAFSDLVYDDSGTSFTDANLAASSTYYYKVRATGSGGTSALSDAVSGTTLSSAGNGSTVKMAAEVNPGLASSNPTSLVVYNNVLYFAATDATNGSQLRTYDGSTLSTISSLASFNPKYLTVFDTKLFMQGQTSSLYSYDGTTLGLASPAVSNPAWLLAAGSTLYMSGYDSTNGQELWSDDGISTASMVADINQTGAGIGSNPAQLAMLGSTLFFSATDGNNGRQLWKSDGTSPNTTMVGSPLTTGINAGADAVPATSAIVALGTSVYFPATTTGSAPYYLYTSNGSGTPTAVSTSIRVSLSAMIVYNGALYLRATDGTDGWELYKYNGSTLSPVADINSGAGDGLAASVTFGVYNNTLYFGATDGVHGNQLYKYDGTSVTQAATINSSGDANPGQFAVLNNRLYFAATDGTTGTELWVLY
jgi:ELWxxDGT repeat protein